MLEEHQLRGIGSKRDCISRFDPFMPCGYCGGAFGGRKCNWHGCPGAAEHRDVPVRRFGERPDAFCRTVGLSSNLSLRQSNKKPRSCGAIFLDWRWMQSSANSSLPKSLLKQVIIPNITLAFRICSGFYHKINNLCSVNSLT
jgi:hypothetical protein